MAKGTILNEIYEALPEGRKRQIEARADEKIKAVRGLQALRKLAGLTQTEIADRLGLAQGNISKLEQNNDMLLSTLVNYVSALGGELEVHVKIHDERVARFDLGHKLN